MENIERRKFIKLVAGGVAVSATFPYHLAQAGSRGYKAVAFDAFPIFDPRPVFKQVKTLFPEKGEQFSLLWRTKIFEYTWLRTSAHQYRNFWQCIDDALQFTTSHLKIRLTTETHQKLMQAFLQLQPYPDVLASLGVLKSQGLKIAFLSNMTGHMLDSNIQHANLQSYFDEVVSTDEVKTFKPDPRAYQLGIDAFGYKKEEIVFAAFASWDAIGARWFGYPTVWVNRFGFTPEVMNIAPDVTGRNLESLVTFVQQSGKV